MLYFIIKLLLTSLLIVIISETARKYSTFGALLASLPLTSLLALIWLYIDTKDIEKISALTREIFWMVIPSLIFFIILPLLLKTKLGFTFSIVLSCTGTSLFYFFFIFILKKIGIAI